MRPNYFTVQATYLMSFIKYSSQDLNCSLSFILSSTIVTMNSAHFQTKSSCKCIILIIRFQLYSSMNRKNQDLRYILSMKNKTRILAEEFVMKVRITLKRSKIDLHILGQQTDTRSILRSKLNGLRKDILLCTVLQMYLNQNEERPGKDAFKI